jgi:hypothetical protein
MDTRLQPLEPAALIEQADRFAYPREATVPAIVLLAPFAEALFGLALVSGWLVRSILLSGAAL